MFIVMDGNNMRNIIRIFGNDPDGKIHKLLDFTDRRGDISDPWYSGRFDIAFDDIYSGCTLYKYPLPDFLFLQGLSL